MSEVFAISCEQQLARVKNIITQREKPSNQPTRSYRVRRKYLAVTSGLTQLANCPEGKMLAWQLKEWIEYELDTTYEGPEFNLILLEIARLLRTFDKQVAAELMRKHTHASHRTHPRTKKESMC